MDNTRFGGCVSAPDAPGRRIDKPGKGFDPRLVDHGFWLDKAGRAPGLVASGRSVGYSIR